MTSIWQKTSRQTALLALGLATLAIFLPSAAQASPSGVVIAQVYPGGELPEQAEAIYDHKYVELFNSGSEAVDVGGWSISHSDAFSPPLEADTDQIPSETTIPPGGYLLIQGAPAGSCDCRLPSAPDLIGSAENPESPASGLIVLRDASGAFQDKVAWLRKDPIFFGLHGWAEWPTFDQGELALYRNEGGCQASGWYDEATSFAVADPSNSASPRNVCQCPPNQAGAQTPNGEPTSTGESCGEGSASEQGAPAGSENTTESETETEPGSSAGSEVSAETEAPNSEASPEPENTTEVEAEAESEPGSSAGSEAPSGFQPLVTASPDASSDSSTLLEAGFEEGLNGWNTSGVGEAVPTVVSSPVRSGSTHSGRFVLSGSQSISQLILGGTGNDNPSATEEFGQGSEYWYGFSFYLQHMIYGHPGASNSIMQFKSNGSGAPNFALQLWNYAGNNGEYKDSPGGGKGLWSGGEAMGGSRFLAPLTEQQWHEVVIHFKASNNGTGFYELFLDGKLIESRKNVSLIVPGNTYGYIKNGLGRNGAALPGTSEMFLDAAKLGTTHASVEPKAAVTTSSGSSGSPLFDGTKIIDYPVNQSAPGAITEVPDPLGSGESVFKMTVNNKDVAPITPTDNPRAQLLTPNMIEPNEEFWLQTKFLLPTNLPSIPGWMSLVAIYGAPFAGSGPWGVAITENEFRFQRNATYDWDIPWKAPLIKGAWVTVLLHERFATNGWVEMWIDGKQLKFFPPGNYNPNHVDETERLAMETMDASNDGAANAAKIMQYRELNMFETGTVYFGALKLGTSRSSVEG